MESNIERIESLKAGVVGAIATGLAAWVLALITLVVYDGISWNGLTIQLSTLLQGAIAHPIINSFK